MHEPWIADIKKGSLDDGPGIRTTVFFKGCPLECVWCHNPECIAPRPEILFRRERCLGARECAPACPPAALGGAGAIDRARCDLCARCADACPSGAWEIVGRKVPVDALAAELLRDQRFYQTSGGGVTLSGGEPALYCEYAGALAERLRARGVHVLLETSGHFDWARFAASLRPHLSAVYIDLKVVDAAAHREACGRDNDAILANLARLVADPGLDTLVRIPLVPGITATPENLRAAAELLRAHGVGRVALLAYNPLWSGKAEGLGRAVRYARKAWMTAEEKAEARAAFAGFEVLGLA